LDFYTLTETCCQIPLDKLFKDGFNTGHGFLREPGSIRTAGALAAIAIQSNQNDQHGGQSIPMFDYYLAPYVALSYVKNIAELAKIKFDLTNEQSKELKKLTVDYWEKAENHRVINQSGFNKLSIILTDYLDSIDIEYTEKQIKRLLENVYDKTHDDTFQSMEAFIHNLNTMHSRAGRRTNMVEVPVTWETLCPAV
jgi:ribonucleoside-triphosphate reductase